MKKETFEKMPPLIDFGLTFSNRPVDWGKVATKYGAKKVSEIKTWRKILQVE